ncbi:hypothetical protein [Sphingomonas sp. PAMC 26621]|uniref:hypothetical protein n=1 Tax=Sphingomonas sp. PAMC 26621 TaxID=1112213 RepID=UPI000288BCFF|nr:hypothetical protein [Sphingomonas sp. PAMC 26621]
MTPAKRSYQGRAIDLPVVLIAALAAVDVSIPAFLMRIQVGSIWQDEALRSPDRRIAIQAHLPPDGLRCVIRLAPQTFYHFPADRINAHAATLPSTAMALVNVPIRQILAHDLLLDDGIMVRRIDVLDSVTPAMGLCLQLEMPHVSVMMPQDP